MLVTDENRELLEVEKYVGRGVKIAFPKKRKNAILSPRINSWAKNGEMEAAVLEISATSMNEQITNSNKIAKNQQINKMTNQNLNSNSNQNLTSNVLETENVHLKFGGNGHSNGNYYQNGSGKLEKSQEGDTSNVRLGENGLVFAGLQRCEAIGGKERDLG